MERSIGQTHTYCVVFFVRVMQCSAICAPRRATTQISDELIKHEITLYGLRSTAMRMWVCTLCGARQAGDNACLRIYLAASSVSHCFCVVMWLFQSNLAHPCSTAKHSTMTRQRSARSLHTYDMTFAVSHRLKWVECFREHIGIWLWTKRTNEIFSLNATNYRLIVKSIRRSHIRVRG